MCDTGRFKTLYHGYNFDFHTCEKLEQSGHISDSITRVIKPFKLPRDFKLNKNKSRPKRMSSLLGWITLHPSTADAAYIRVFIFKSTTFRIW